MVVIRECDCRGFSHYLQDTAQDDCSNQLPEGDKKVVCKITYHKRYYAESKERILARQKRWCTENAEMIKARLETKREQINGAKRAYCKENREHIRSYQRKYCQNNRERINEY